MHSASIARHGAEWDEHFNIRAYLTFLKEVLRALIPPVDPSLIVKRKTEQRAWESFGPVIAPTGPSAPS